MSVFGHGQLRLYLLALLQDGPRHGYDIIRDLENRFSGLYSPSAGTVYPRLAKLEEEGLVERTDEGRKALYRLTDAGRAEAEARAADIDELETSLDASAERLADEMRARVRAGAEELRTEMTAATAQYRTTADDPGSPWSWATDAAGGAVPPAFDLDALLGGLTRGNLPDPDAIARAARRWGFGGSPEGRREGWETDAHGFRRARPGSPPGRHAGGAGPAPTGPDVADAHRDDDPGDRRAGADAPTSESGAMSARGGDGARESDAATEPSPSQVTKITRGERNASGDAPEGDEVVVEAGSPPPAGGPSGTPMNVRGAGAFEASADAVIDEDAILGEVVEDGEAPADSAGSHDDRRQESPFPSPDQVREVVAILKDAGERIRRVLEAPRD